MATYKDDLDILDAAKKDANKLSLNAITELDNKGLLGMYGGGGSGKAIPDEFGLMLYGHKDEIPFPEDWPMESGDSLQEVEYISKNYEYVKTVGESDESTPIVYAQQTAFNTVSTFGVFSAIDGDPLNGWFFQHSGNTFVFLPNGKAYLMTGGK